MARLALVIVVAAVCVGCDDSDAGLDSVRLAMTKDDVRARAGEPMNVLEDLNGPEPDKPGQADPCWLYPVEFPDFRYICFGEDGRVARISTSIHTSPLCVAGKTRCDP
jgi:hypothetical protein